MLVDEEFKNFVLDQLDNLITFESKSMFGGLALLYEGKAFAKIKHNKVWLKVNDSTKDDFEKLGMIQYSYGKDQSRKLNFYEAPIEIIEDRDQFVEWVKRSIEIIIE